MTIKGIGLDRPQLREARAKYLKRVTLHYETVQVAESLPNIAELQTLAKHARRYLREAQHPAAEFSSMVIDHLERLSRHERTQDSTHQGNAICG